MTARNVQASLDQELLAEVDRHKEASRVGRSAFVLSRPAAPALPLGLPSFLTQVAMSLAA
jgi:hypothetical protein